MPLACAHLYPNPRSAVPLHPTTVVRLRSSLLGGVANEKAMMRAEIWRRLRPSSALPTSSSSALQKNQSAGAAAAAAQ